MKKPVAWMMLALSALLALPVQASGVEALMKSKSCFACHATNTKMVGPSYKDVAAKYKTDKGAVSKLALKIRKGGSGVWGGVPMPANAVSEAEAQQMAEWVLKVK